MTGPNLFITQMHIHFQFAEHVEIRANLIYQEACRIHETRAMEAIHVSIVAVEIALRLLHAYPIFLSELCDYWGEDITIVTRAFVRMCERLHIRAPPFDQRLLAARFLSELNLPMTLLPHVLQLAHHELIAMNPKVLILASIWLVCHQRQTFLTRHSIALRYHIADNTLHHYIQILEPFTIRNGPRIYYIHL